MKKEKTYFFDKKENVRKVIYVFFALCGLFFLADFFVHRHTYYEWEGIPGFYALFGFAAYVVIVFTAATLRKVAMRSEDYYETTEDEI
jgi:phosphatidylserine synthase